MRFTDRFWAKVSKAGDGECWLWRAALNRHGYGLFSVAGRSRLAHRVSAELSCGVVQRGEVVRHTCDTPACVNPLHLVVGSQFDNVQDMVEKGRQARGESHRRALLLAVPRGERHWRSRLTLDAVRDIRKAVKAGVRQKDLAAKYGVDPSSISLAVSGKTWLCVSQ